MTCQSTEPKHVPIRFEETGGVIHVRFAGRSFDISAPGLDVDRNSHDDEVKFAIASYLEVPSYRLDEYVIDRHTKGNMTLRPHVAVDEPQTRVIYGHAMFAWKVRADGRAPQGRAARSATA